MTNQYPHYRANNYPDYRFNNYPHYRANNYPHYRANNYQYSSYTLEPLIEFGFGAALLKKFRKAAPVPKAAPTPKLLRTKPGGLTGVNPQLARGTRGAKAKISPGTGTGIINARPKAIAGAGGATTKTNVRSSKPKGSFGNESFGNTDMSKNIIGKRQKTFATREALQASRSPKPGVGTKPTKKQKLLGSGKLRGSFG